MLRQNKLSLNISLLRDSPVVLQKNRLAETSKKIALLVAWNKKVHLKRNLLELLQRSLFCPKNLMELRKPELLKGQVCYSYKRTQSIALRRRNAKLGLEQAKLS